MVGVIRLTFVAYPVVSPNLSSDLHLTCVAAVFPALQIAEWRFAIAGVESPELTAHSLGAMLDSGSIRSTQC